MKCTTHMKFNYSYTQIILLHRFDISITKRCYHYVKTQKLSNRFIKIKFFNKKNKKKYFCTLLNSIKNNFNSICGLFDVNYL